MPNMPELFRLDRLVTLVTGGGGGIGRATAKAFASLGATVVVVDLDADSAAETAAACEKAGGQAWSIQADLSNEAEVEAAFKHIAERESALDVLVNNAGIAIRMAAIDLPLADWDKVVSVNMTGTFLCARAAARAMIAAGNGGAIVNIASIMGLSGGGLYPNISYQTTKGAVVNMTRALATEWATNGIRVNAVAPTYVRTQLTAALLKDPEMIRRIEAMTPLRRLAEPDEVAAAICFLASPAAAMITGHVLPVDGGFLAQ